MSKKFVLPAVAALFLFSALVRSQPVQNTFNSENPVYSGRWKSRSDSVKCASLQKLCDSLFSSNLHSAEQIGDSALLLARSAIVGGDHPDLASCINNVATICWQEGRFAVSVPLFSEALGIQRRIFHDGSQDLATTLNNFAVLYNDMGNYSDAEPLYLESLSMYKRLPTTSPRDLAICISSLGLFYDDWGHYERAESLLLESLELSRRSLKQNDPVFSTVINNLAEFYDHRGRYAEATQLFLEALNISRHYYTDDHPDYATSIGNMGMVYKDQGKDSEARPLLEEALAMYRRIGDDDRGYQIALNNLALIYEKLGFDTKAGELFKESLSMCRRLVPGDHSSTAMSLNNLARFYDNSKKYQLARPLFKEALEMRRRLGSPVDLLSSLGSVLCSGQDLEYDLDQVSLVIQMDSILEAMTNQSLQFESESEQLQFLSSLKEDQNIVVNACLNGEVHRRILSDLLWSRTLRSKARILLGLEQRIKLVKAIDRGDSETSILWKNYCYDRTALSKLSRSYGSQEIVVRIHVLDSEATRLEKQILARTREQSRSDWIASREAIQSKLSKLQAAIEIIQVLQFKNNRWADSIVYYALVVRRDAKYPEVIPLCEERKLVEILKHDPTSDENSYLRDVATRRKLSTLIWQPIEKYLTGIKTIYLSPDGLLSRVSFGVLEDSTGTSLVDKYDLHYVSSTRELVTRDSDEQKEELPKTAAVFGGCIYDLDSAAQMNAIEMSVSSPIPMRGADLPDYTIRGQSIAYLPWTRREADTISDLMRAAGFSVSRDTGLLATEETFKHISSPRILHVATHGFFFSESEHNMMRMGRSDVFSVADNPMLRSGLLLTGAGRVWRGKPTLENAEDGIVTAYDIATMDLSKTELVVLSACETGLGDIKGTEGVFGLQRAFRAAGAKSVIMSLWKVHDEATMLLMREFYTRWLIKKESKEQAFIEAQRELRKTHNPEDWAAFVMVEK